MIPLILALSDHAIGDICCTAVVITFLICLTINQSRQ